MKTNFFISGLIIVLLYFLYLGCQKPASTPVSGRGGKATLVVTPIHLGLNVDSCMVFIKYNASDVPANNIYDDSQKCFLSDTTPLAVFSGLKKGSYYLFGDGFHLTYNSFVKGGIPININAEDSNFVLLPTFPYVK